MTRASTLLSDLPKALPWTLAFGLMALLVCAPAAWAADPAQVTLLTGPNRSAAFEIFGPRLAQAVQPTVAVDVQVAPGSWDNLEAVAADPSIVAFSQFDLYQRFVAERGLEHALEYYGSVPVCLFAAARVGSPITLGLEGAAGGVALETVDIGPSNGDTALTYDALRLRVPTLAELEVQHRGWSRALARLAQGELDLFVFVEYPHAEAPLVKDVLGNGRVVLLDNVVEVLGPISLTDASPYLPTQASFPQGGWFDDRFVGQTLCTSLGVVVHRDGDPLVLEAVVHAATHGALLRDGNGSWWQSLTGRLTGWLDQGRRLAITFLEQL